MSFWDKMKRFLSGEPALPFEEEVRAAVERRAGGGAQFTGLAIGKEATAHLPEAGPDERKQALATLEKLWARGAIERLGYARVRIVLTSGSERWLYHRADRAPDPGAVAAGAVIAAKKKTPPASGASGSQRSTRPASGGAQRSTSRAGATARKSKGAKGRPATARDVNPYDAGDLLRLSPDELRARALQINPLRTAWIGRTDVIPPQADERTALIDRGLILRGLLTEAEIAEIHRVGDLWLEHRGGARLAETRAAKSADAAIALLQEQAAERKKEKQRLAAERREKRAADVARRRAEDIVFLGRGVSRGLADRRAHVERLRERGLPVLATPADVAKALGVSISRLRWLCYHDEALERIHYVQFEVPKRSGGMRLLSAPHRELAAAQTWVLENVLAKLPATELAHGFVAGRSTVTNALPHRGQALVVNLNLESFFPSISFARVRGVFGRLGYSRAAATILALLCTEAPRRVMEYEGKRWHVAIAPRGLPQGACTSPALSNQVARGLDRRLAGIAKKYGVTYTRYADDLTLSFPAEARAGLPRLLARVRHVIVEEGFAIQLKKGRVQRSGGRQTVTGVVVNDRDKLGLPRDEVRNLRAILHNAKKTGLEAQNRTGRPHFARWLEGKIAYLMMIDREKGEALRAALRELRADR